MKRLLVASVLAALLAPGAFALDLIVGPRLLLGDYVGWGSDYADMLDTLDADPALRLGASIGVFAETALPWWGLVARPELAYTSGGSAIRQAGSSFGAYDGDVKTSFVYKFIELTPLVKKSFGKWSAFAGPDLLFAVGSWEAKVKADDSSFPDGTFGLSRVDFHKVYLGLVLGGGYPFAVGPGTLTVDLRAQVWFTNFDEHNDVNAKQAAFVAGVSYGFPVKL